MGPKKMSTERNIKETLAKKLVGKKIKNNMLVPKIEQAENKSQYFKEIKNKEICSKNTKNKEDIALGREEPKIPEQSKNANINPTINVTQIKRSSRILKQVPMDDVKTSLQIVKTKSLKVSKIPSENILVRRDEEPSTSKKIKQDILEEKWQPPKWKTMLENVRIMRSDNKAPVDTMGCHKCADENSDEKTQRFHKLVALMLSSQTRDETTYHAMLRLREHNLTPEVISNMKINVLENIIHPVSFYKEKLASTQALSKWIL